MAESKHLLYIFPDVAYAVELAGGKEAGSFVVRDYLQVNGEFMNENELIAENLEKLAGKIQSNSYDLILPDFLFTNTVVNVDKTGEDAVDRYVKETLMPSLEITEDSHLVQSFILTEFKGNSKVQVSALEKSLLKPVAEYFGAGSPAIVRSVLPLSWTLKSLISLEPSISVVQMGANLYLAQHYIGVDQANEAAAEDAEKLIETVKTLKGAEPSIQTLYLLSSGLVEKKLREGLKATLPLQQLADEDETSEMPSYIKQIVEAGAKTLAVPDYKVPVFALGNGSPVAPAPAPAKETMIKTAKAEEAEETQKLPEADEAELPSPSELTSEPSEKAEPEKEPELEFADVPAAAPAAETAEETASAAVDLTQFSSKEENEEEQAPAVEAEKPTPVVEAVPAAPTKRVIKNDAGVNSMVRMIFIGLASFFVTVGIGLGIGLGLLTFTKETPSTDTPVTQITPTAEPTPTPTPTPAINRADHTLLVVNATTKAGYAGQIADKLEAAGFESVAAKNAVGDYETGNFVLTDEANPALVSLLSTDTGLTLTQLTEEKTVEDPNNTYTIVIVLAE